MVGILEDVMPVNLIVNIKLPNKRAYDVAWAVAKLNDYEDLDDFINDSFLKTLEMYPEGTASLDMEEDDWGFKSRQRYHDRPDSI